MRESETMLQDSEREYRAVLLAYELIVDAREMLARHGVPVPQLTELKAAAARMGTLDEALSAIRELGRVVTAVIAGQPQPLVDPVEADG